MNNLLEATKAVLNSYQNSTDDYSGKVEHFMWYLAVSDLNEINETHEYLMKDMKLLDLPVSVSGVFGRVWSSTIEEYDDKHEKILTLYVYQYCDPSREIKIRQTIKSNHENTS